MMALHTTEFIRALPAAGCAGRAVWEGGAGQVMLGTGCIHSKTRPSRAVAHAAESSL